MGHNVMKDSPIPVYYQIYVDLKQKLLNSGLVDEEGKLPPERDLADSYQVSRVTMRQSMAELEKDGLIVRYRGRGSFLKTQPKPLVHSLDLPATSKGNSVRSYIDKGPEILELSLFDETYEEISKALRYQGKIYYIKRLMKVDGNPIAINKIWIPAYFTPNLETIGLCVEGSLSKTLDEIYHLRAVRRENIVEALRPTCSEENLLEITSDALILQIASTSYLVDDTPYEHSITSWIGDSIRLKIDVSDIEHGLLFSNKQA